MRENQTAEPVARLKPSDPAVLDDVLRVLKTKEHPDHFVTPYQILNQLRDDLRRRLIEGYGMPGAGGGREYTADSAVSNAAEMLVKRGKAEADERWLDTRGIYVVCEDKTIQPGSHCCRLYRRPKDQQDR